MSGGPTFSQVMGHNYFFYRTCCFPGGFGLPVPPPDSGIAYHGARVYVCGLLKSPKKKHAVRSSKAYAFRVIKTLSP